MQSSFTSQQTCIWLRGLLTLAWSDGNFDEQEQALIADLLHQDLTEAEKSAALEPIAPADLVSAIGTDRRLAENFLRMAVMVALADGEYSASEDALLEQYRQALGLDGQVLQVLRSGLEQIKAESAAAPAVVGIASPLQNRDRLAPQLDKLAPVRHWLDQMEVHDPKVARLLCKMIPAQCPFERDVVVFGHKVAHIPAMCKLNPLYDQLVGLRFRALSYLADDCDEDVSAYC